MSCTSLPANPPPVRASPASPASLRSRVASPPAPLPCPLLSTTTPAQSPSLERRALRFRPLQSKVSRHPPSGSQARRASGLLRNIQKHASGQQHYQQTRSSVAHKRQRNPFRRHHPQHHSKINQRLKNHHRRHAQRQHAAKPIWRIERRSNSAPSVNGKQSDHKNRAQETQLLANHRVNENHVRLRQVKQFLLALNQTEHVEPSRADRNH